MLFKSCFLFALALALVACQATNPPKTDTPAPQGKTSAQEAKKPARQAKTPAKPQPKAGADNAAATQIVPNLTGPQKIPLVLAPGSATYPKEWGEQGVQGEVTISALIKADNSSEQVAVLKSSGNPQLDENALAFVQRVKFRLEKRRSATEPEPVELEFRFYTHYLESFWQKTCGQFIKDVEYFKKTFPAKPADEVFGYRAMSGFAFLAAIQKNPQLVPSGNTFAQDVEFCQKNPAQLLMPHLMERSGNKTNTKDAASR